MLDHDICAFSDFVRQHATEQMDRDCWERIKKYCKEALKPSYNNARDEIIQDCGNCYYGYVHQGPFKCLRPDDVPCCHHSYWKCITSPVA